MNLRVFPWFFKNNTETEVTATEGLPVREVRPSILDIFGNRISATRYNWMEVPFDAGNYAEFINEDSQHGGTVQAKGETRLTTGTHQAGYCLVTCLDPVRYRSGQEAGTGFTIYYPLAGVAGARQRIGAMFAPEGVTPTWANSVWMGYDDAGLNFGIYYFRDGNQKSFTSLAEINAKLGYALDPTKDQICRLLFGLFGHKGWAFEVCTEAGNDESWVQVASYSGVNVDQGPIFATEFLIHTVAEVRKPGGGNTNVQIATSCWAGWTTSGAKRLSDPFTPRTLVVPGQVVVTGESSAGGGSYPNLKLTPSGAAEVNANQGTDPWHTTDPSDLIEREHVGGFANSAGANVVRTPGAGNALRVFWTYVMKRGTDIRDPSIVVRFGATDIRYAVYNGIMKRQLMVGAVDEPLIVELSTAADVAYTFTVEEFTP